MEALVVMVRGHIIELFVVYNMCENAEAGLSGAFGRFR